VGKKGVTLDERRKSGNEQRIVALASPDPRVAVHWARRSGDEALARTFDAILSPGERARALRFGQPDLARRYVVGRGTLRTVLGMHLHISPAQVPIMRGRRGRPVLAGETGVDFNVTHTGEVMLIAIAHGVIAGVDVERAARQVNVAGIARRCLSPSERNALATMDADEARLHVLRLWTCKEAMSKATGDGLAAPFRALDVALAPGPLLRQGPSPYTPGDWQLHALEVPTGYLATLALWRRAGAGAS
jgi:4'-phosphopantetheinyl transferase